MTTVSECFDNRVENEMFAGHIAHRGLQGELRHFSLTFGRAAAMAQAYEYIHAMLFVVICLSNDRYGLLLAPQKLRGWSDPAPPPSIVVHDMVRSFL